MSLMSFFSDPRVTFLYGDDCDLAIYCEAMPRDIDVLFSDTVHTYEQIKSEYGIYEPLLADEAMIIVDDIKLNDKGRFFEEWLGEKSDLIGLCRKSGFDVMVYRRIGTVDQELRVCRAALASTQVWKRRNFAAQAEVKRLRARSFKVRFLRPIYRHLPAAVYEPFLAVPRRQN